MNFDLSLISQEKQKISLDERQDQPMCQFTMKEDTKNVGEQLITWENFLENILTHINNGYRILRPLYLRRCLTRKDMCQANGCLILINMVMEGM